MAIRYLWVFSLLSGLCISSWSQGPPPLKIPGKQTGLSANSPAGDAWMDKHVRRIRNPKELRTFTGKTIKDLPARVVNIDYLPKVGQQAYGSCVSWALVYYHKTWQEAKEHGWLRPDPATRPDRVMSPAFVFNLANGGYISEGTSIADNLFYLLNYGACTTREMPANYDPYLWPQEEDFLAAFPYRAQSSASLAINTEAGLSALKEHLATGDVATFSMTIYNNWSQYPTPADGIDGDVFFGDGGTRYIPPGGGPSGHMLCIIGYDDNKTYVNDEGQTRQGAILLVNSWGTDWGIHLAEAGEAGFMWLAYDYLLNYSIGDAHLMVDRIGYEPSLVGSFHVQHGRRLELRMDLIAGDPENPDYTMEVFPQTGGFAPIDQTIAFDASDFAGNNTYSWWLRVEDWNIPQYQPNYSGFIHSFKIKRADGTLWQSPDTPVATVEIMQTGEYAWANVASLHRKTDWFTHADPGIGAHTWGDLDGDGDYDFIFTNAQEGAGYALTVFRNDGESGWNEVDGALPPFNTTFQALGDYDGDGLPDLVINGYDDSQQAWFTQLWHNAGNCIFYDSGMTLPLSDGRLTWVDFNNDGRLDLCLNEYDPVQGLVGLQLFVNQGNGAFVKQNLNIPASNQYAFADYNLDGWLDLAVCQWGETKLYRQSAGALIEDQIINGEKYGCLAWGDADNDGRLDLFISRQNGNNQPFVGELWRNTSNGFTFWNSLPGTLGGGATWGDLDNDGLADLCIWGDFGGPDGFDANVQTIIMRNEGGGQFRNFGFNLRGAGFLTQGPFDMVKLMDFDRDGDLDLSVCGPGSRLDGYPKALHLYENKAADSSGLNRPNQAPSLPGGLASSQATPTGPITLTWNQSNDAETPSGGLFYNLRIGSAPGWGDIMPPGMEAPLTGNHLRPFLSAGQPGFRLEHPPNTPIYWSVQALDPSQGASYWTAPKLHRPAGSNAIPGDVDANGLVDITDLVRASRMAAGLDPPDLTRADLNSSGTVDIVDCELIKAAVLGAASIGPRVIGGGQIGSEGGQISASGYNLTVPSGAFPSPSTIWVSSVPGDSPLGNNALGPRFQTDGIPSDFTQPLTLTLHTDATPQGDVFMEFSEVTSPPSSSAERQVTQLQQVTALGNGDYQATLLPAEPSAQPRAATQASRYRLTVTEGLIHNYGTWANAHFSIGFPLSVDFNDVVVLGNALEEAYQELAGQPYHFSYAKRTQWPLQVTVLEMDDKKYGEFAPSKRGDNFGSMEFNSLKLADHEHLRTTAVHEFFHFVQHLYDPRSGYIKAVSGKTYLWLMEAASVWSEELLGTAPYTPPFYESNIKSPFNGMHAAGASGTKGAIQDHGYGMASLIKYLKQYHNPAAPRLIFEKIAAGKSQPEAIALSSPSSDFAWWSTYLEEWISDQLYPIGVSNLAILAPADQQFAVSTSDDFLKSRAYSADLPDLSGRLYVTAFSNSLSGLTADHKLSCRLRGVDLSDPKIGMVLLLARNGLPTEFLAEGLPANGAVKVELGNLPSIQAQQGKILCLISNQRTSSSFEEIAPIQMQWAITHPQQKTLPSKTVYGSWNGQTLPVMNFSGQFDGEGWADWRELDFGLISGILIDVLGTPPLDFNLSYPGSISTGTVTLPAEANGDYEVWTVSDIKSYRLEIFQEGQLISTQNSMTAQFVVSINEDTTWLGVTMYAVYDLVQTRFDLNDTQIGQTIETDIHFPVFTAALLP